MFSDGIFADEEIILTTSTEPNAVVANILVKLTGQRRRRRRRVDCPYDLPPVAHLTMQSPTFYLDNASKWNIFMFHMRTWFTLSLYYTHFRSSCFDFPSYY